MLAMVFQVVARVLLGGHYSVPGCCYSVATVSLLVDEGVGGGAMVFYMIARVDWYVI